MWPLVHAQLMRQCLPLMTALSLFVVPLMDPPGLLSLQSLTLILTITLTLTPNPNPNSHPNPNPIPSPPKACSPCSG